MKTVVPTTMNAHHLTFGDRLTEGQRDTCGGNNAVRIESTFPCGLAIDGTNRTSGWRGATTGGRFSSGTDRRPENTGIVAFVWRVRVAPFNDLCGVPEMLVNGRNCSSRVERYFRSCTQGNISI